MKNPDESIDAVQLYSLREGVKEKYKQYHLTDRDRFPAIQYNTNRNNYEPLRTSIEVELFTVRGIEKTTDFYQIPSTSTLANLFTNDGYVPGKKLLSTYLLYAEANEKGVAGSKGIAVPDFRSRYSKWSITSSFSVFIVLVVALMLAVYLWRPFWASTSPGTLRVTRPKANALVPWEVVIEGTVTNAETVWLVVRHEKGYQYYVQPQVRVQNDGSWLGVIYIGRDSSDNAGLTFQIRALVKPVSELARGEIYYDWPEAELTSEILEVVRK